MGVLAQEIGNVIILLQIQRSALPQSPLQNIDAISKRAQNIETAT